MKSLIFSCITAAVLIIFVFVNSFVVGFNIDKMVQAIESAPNDCQSAEIYKQLFDDYKRREKYIALSVSHSDLLGIEDSFAEILGAIEANDEETLTIQKSRIIKALAHIKRLAAVNFDSVF